MYGRKLPNTVGNSLFPDRSRSLCFIKHVDILDLPAWLGMNQENRERFCSSDTSHTFAISQLRFHIVLSLHSLRTV